MKKFLTVFLLTLFSLSLYSANPLFKEYILDKTFEMRWNEKRTKDPKTKNEKYTYNFEQVTIYEKVVKGVGKVCLMDVYAGTWTESKDGSGGGGNPITFDCAIQGNNQVFFGHVRPVYFPPKLSEADYKKYHQKLKPDLQKILEKIYVKPRTVNYYVYSNLDPTAGQAMNIKNALDSSFKNDYYEIHISNDGTKFEMKLKSTGEVKKYFLSKKKR